MANLHLKVQRIEQVCLFELSWGKGQQLSVAILYPQNLTILYQEWQQCYLNYYKTALRGRVADIGCIVMRPVDWQAKLVQAEAKLLSEFHNWLRSGELYEIRAKIFSIVGEKSPQPITIFLTCNSLELARLPWEHWEIGTEFALSRQKIRIVRTPINIYQTVKNKTHHRRTNIRVLAILGDDTGLDFQAEKEAIAKLNSIADVEFIGWQPGQNVTQLKTQIKNVLISERGWDILFFAGHSNETALTGGEIAIAPNITLSISEIAPAINTALERGLQFAIFNSCNGLSIANTLIDLGLSQVAVMREPIHNSVASEFLLLFLQSLAQFQDVYEALSSASQYLKLERNLTYPSSYLIPSLFCHPEASLFRLEPFGIQESLKKMIPSRYELIAIFSLLLISLQLPVQKFLLERRLLTQAVYQQLTGQVAPKSTAPVLLLQIDEKSIQLAKISNPAPMNRKYLASLIDQLVQRHAKIIGINYLLDRHQEENDKILAKSIQAAVNKPDPTWFIFAKTSAVTGEQLQVLPNIASSNWSLQGGFQLLPGYMQLPSLSDSQPEASHFTSLLAHVHQLQFPPTYLEDKEKLKQLPQPLLNSKTDFLQQINGFVKSNKFDKLTTFNSPRSHLQPLTEFSYYLGQMWLHPIIDFSIPPDRIYHRLSAWQLLEKGRENTIPSLEHQIVIITSGGYGNVGLANSEDNFELPPAIKYWRSLENPEIASSIITGGEIQAYMVHHLLNQRLVVPIPDLWMIGIGIFIGKFLSYYIHKNPRYKWQYWILYSIFTSVYGLVSLQIYLSSVAVLLPWLLPSVAVSIYVIPALRTQRN
jgi:hypothetical protein